MSCHYYDGITNSYSTELWLLEDMSLAIVRCVNLVIERKQHKYETK